MAQDDEFAPHHEADQSVPAKRQTFNIPAGDLQSALLTYAHEVDFQLLYPADLTVDLTTQGVQGNHTPEQALRALLDGTGIRYSFTGTNTLTLVRVASAQSRWLAPIVVTPPLLGAAGDQERFDRVEPSARLTREQFEQMPSDRRLSDVIDRMPGVFFRGPVGVNRDIKLRGMDKGFTRFELDGIQLPGLGGERDFRVNRLSPLSIDVIELLRNPGAAHESDGIAGRIIARSRPIPDAFMMEAEALTGGVDKPDGSYRQLRLALGDKPSELFGYNLFVDSAHVPRQKDKSKTTLDAAGNLKEEEVEDEQVVEDSLNLSADLRWRKGSDTFHLKPRFDRQDSNKNKTKNKTKPGGDPQQERETGRGEDMTAGIVLEHTRDFTGGTRLKSDLSYFKTDEESFKLKQAFKGNTNGFALDKTEEEIARLDDHFWQLRSGLKLPLDLLIAQDLGMGIQARLRDRSQEMTKVEIKPDGVQKDKTEPGDNYTVRERLLAAYVEDEFFFSERLSLKPGVRIERVETETRAEDGTNVNSGRTDINPSLHLRYGLNDRLVFKAAASRKVNRPKFEQMVPFRKEKGDRFEEGNPDVEPAHAWIYDAGLTYSTHNVLLSLLAFHKDVRNVIDVGETGEQLGGKDIFRVGNFGDGWVQGIELEQRINLRMLGERWSGLVLWANQGFYDSELTVAGTGEKQPFDEQRDYIINLGFDYRFPNQRTLLTVAGKYLGDLEKAKGLNEFEVEKARLLLDVGLRHQLTPNVMLTADIANLLDPDQEKYQYKGDDTTFDTETPGRVFFVGVEGKF